MTSEVPTGRGKKLLKNTGVLYVRMLLILLVSLYTVKVVLRELGVVDYGIYNVIGGFIALVGFMNAALAQTTQRFISFELGRLDGRPGTVFATAVLTHAVFAVAIYIVGWLIGTWAIDHFLNFPDSRRDAVVIAFQFSLSMFCLNVVQVPFLSAVIAEERMHVFALISVLETLLKLAVAVSIAYAAGDRLVHYTGFLLAASMLGFVAYIIASRGIIRIAARGPRWDLATAKSMVSQIGWNLWGNLAAAFGNHGVNLLLNVFFGPTINAARAIAYQAHGAVGMFITNIQTAITPQITKSYAADDHVFFARLVNSGAKLFALVFITTATPVILEADYLLNLWLDNPPEYAAIFTRLVVLTLLAHALSGTLQSAAQATGKVRRYNLILGTISLLNVPVCWLVLKMGGAPEATLYVGLALSGLMLAVRLSLVAMIAPIQPGAYVRQVLVPVCALLAIAFAAGVIPMALMESSFLRLLAVCASTSLLAAGLGYGFILDHSERQLVLHVAKKLLPRRARIERVSGETQ